MNKTSLYKGILLSVTSATTAYSLREQGLIDTLIAIAEANNTSMEDVIENQQALDKVQRKEICLRGALLEHATSVEDAEYIAKAENAMLTKRLAVSRFKPEINEKLYGLPNKDAGIEKRAVEDTLNVEEAPKVEETAKAKEAPKVEETANTTPIEHKPQVEKKEETLAEAMTRRDKMAEMEEKWELNGEPIEEMSKAEEMWTRLLNKKINVLRIAIDRQDDLIQQNEQLIELATHEANLKRGFSRRQEPLDMRKIQDEALQKQIAKAIS